MGQSLNPMQTHEAVPEHVKSSIPPIDYEPCPLEERQKDCEACEDCGSAFGWFCASTNCDRCGRMLCTRCCPTRYLLRDRPGCMACTQAAYRQRRSEMLQSHYSAAGVSAPVRSRGQTILVGPRSEDAPRPVMGVPAVPPQPCRVSETALVGGAAAHAS